MTARTLLVLTARGSARSMTNAPMRHRRTSSASAPRARVSPLEPAMCIHQTHGVASSSRNAQGLENMQDAAPRQEAGFRR